MIREKPLGYMDLHRIVLHGVPELVLFAPGADPDALPARAYMLVRDIDAIYPGMAEYELIQADRHDLLEGIKGWKACADMTSEQRERVFSWLDNPRARYVDAAFLDTLAIRGEIPEPPDEPGIMTVRADVVGAAVNALHDLGEFAEDTFEDGANGFERKRTLDFALGGLVRAMRGQDSDDIPQGFIWGITELEIEGVIIELGYDPNEVDIDAAFDAAGQAMTEYAEGAKDFLRDAVRGALASESSLEEESDGE